MAQYHLQKIIQPYEEGEDQDMWVAEISFENQGDQYGMINHDECIEVRAESEAVLRDRVNVILDALATDLTKKSYALNSNFVDEGPHFLSMEGCYTFDDD